MTVGPSLRIEDHYEETNMWGKSVFVNRLAVLIRRTLNYTQQRSEMMTRGQMRKQWTSLESKWYRVMWTSDV